jgi:O-antigen ligase/polysaccharide polymerase Wzy-like membrane protein
MTTAVPSQSTPLRAQPAPPWQFPYATIFTLLIATVIIGTVAFFSVPAAAVLYVPFYLVFCWFRPYAALALMWGEVAFPFNVNGMSGLANTAPAEISLCLAFPVFWMRSLIEHRRGVFNPVAPVVWIYYIICLMSTLVHWSGRDAIVSIGQMALYLTVAPKFFSSFISDRRQMFTAMYGLIAATTFVALTLLVLREDDVYGVHKNATGTFLSYTVIILAELWLLAATAGRRRGWINLLLLINFAGIVMSTSRGAWIGCIAGITVLLLARRQWAIFFRALLVVLPALALCWYYVPESQRDYALNFSEDARNIKSRMDNAQFFYDHFIQSPVIGVGVGLRKERDSTNIIMSTLAETGVLGLISFLAIQITFLWIVFRAMRRVPRGDPDFTILVLGAALVLCLFGHGMVDHYWSRTQLPVWGMGGAAIGVAYARRYGGDPARRL